MSDEEFPRVPKKVLDEQEALKTTSDTGHSFNELGLGVQDDVELNRLLAVRFEGTDYDDDEISEAITHPETKLYPSANLDYYVLELHMYDGQKFRMPVPKSAFVTYN